MPPCRSCRPPPGIWTSTCFIPLILERRLGIDKRNMAAGVNLTYTRSLREALDDVEAGAYQAAFLLNPTRVEEIRDVAAAGRKCPRSPPISIRS